MKIGITCSSFDLFHAGHVKMLEEAKQHCDYLIIALQTDPTIDRPEKNKPIQSVVERYIQVEACKHVDQIIPYTTEKDLEDIFMSFKLDCRIIGSEYEDKYFTGNPWIITTIALYQYWNHKNKELEGFINFITLLRDKKMDLAEQLDKNNCENRSVERLTWNYAELITLMKELHFSSLFLL